MTIGVDLLKKVTELFPLRIGVCVLFSKVPVQRQMMAETSKKFTIV
jgi:hypothetical protein